ncbi:hypothetical protein ACIBCU_38240 [Streptomyces sp. NPDC051064]|uniref:hypothetical protein n=1 Tax=Streptomyces sp. NPDC051064 TaxID=3365641 RepID=UPI0037983539
MLQLREQVARVEAAAQEAEDYARLSPRERSERCGAHLLLDATPAGEEVQIEAVSLATIQDKLSIGRTTASELRIVALGRHPGRLPPLTRHQNDGGRHPGWGTALRCFCYLRCTARLPPTVHTAAAVDPSAAAASGRSNRARTTTPTIDRTPMSTITQPINFE